MSDAAWLDELYDEGIGSFDAISMHPFNYGFAPGDETNRWGLKYSYALGVPWVHDSMAAHGDGDKKIWFTEFGWSSCTNPPGTSTWCIGPDAQAQHIADAIRMMRDRWPYVEGAFVYNLRNKGTDPAGARARWGCSTTTPSSRRTRAFADVLDELDHTEPPPPGRSPIGATTPLTQARDPTAPAVRAGTVEAESTTPAPASAPALRGLAVRPQRLRSKRALRKALLVWRLSEPARLDLVLQRRVRGRLRSAEAGADRGREVRKRPRAAHADRTLARERPLRDPRRGDGRGRQSLGAGRGRLQRAGAEPQRLRRYARAWRTPSRADAVMRQRPLRRRDLRSVRW